MTVAHLNSKTNIKKLQYGESKCQKLHVGKNRNICAENSVDTWSLEKESVSVSSVWELVDKEGGKHVIETVTSDKYLGDIISSDGRNTLNIQERKRRGLVAVNQISEMLSDLCLGQYHFEAGNLLRNSLLLSTVLSNSEAWYNLTKKEISDLESVDEALMRKILSAHSKTPVELLYLETGNIPIRFILKARRLNFLWYILNENEDSLLRQCFNSQYENPSKGDWVLTVREDLRDLEISLDMETIANTRKEEFKRIVKNAVKERSLEYLQKLQEKHSKARDISYESLELQPYLRTSCEASMTITQKQFLFAARSRMIDLRANFKFGKSDVSCRACHQTEENQEHLLECPELQDNEVAQSVVLYSDIFGDNSEKLAVISKILHKRLKILQTTHCEHRDNGCSATNVSNMLVVME